MKRFQRNQQRGSHEQTNSMAAQPAFHFLFNYDCIISWPFAPYLQHIFYWRRVEPGRLLALQYNMQVLKFHMVHSSIFSFSLGLMDLHLILYKVVCYCQYPTNSNSHFLCLYRNKQKQPRGTCSSLENWSWNIWILYEPAPGGLLSDQLLTKAL